MEKVEEEWDKQNYKDKNITQERKLKKKNKCKDSIRKIGNEHDKTEMLIL